MIVLAKVLEEQWTNVWPDGYFGRSGKEYYYYLTFEEDAPHQQVAGLGGIKGVIRIERR